MGYALSFLFVGLGCWLAAGAFLSAGMRIRGITKATRNFETRWAADVSGAAPGTMVEVKGNVRCENPLTSEMAGAECAYYLSQVIREYREAIRDSDGKYTTVTNSEIVASSEGATNFIVQDGSGFVEVVVDGADFQAFEVAVNRVDKDDGEAKSITLGGSTVILDGGERTTGYRHSERILPPDATVYVLGAVGSGGRIEAAENQRVLIGYYSAERTGKVTAKMARRSILGGVGFFAFGLISIGVGVYGLVVLS